jgi:hypothetical protein
MHSKVDDNLVLSSDGREVAVSGPISEWDDDESSATFTVVIAQIADDGVIVLARGRSHETYQNGARTWRATAHVSKSGVRLSHGAAQAWALASIAGTNGDFELYPWSLETHLVDDVVVAAAAAAR